MPKEALMAVLLVAIVAGVYVGHRTYAWLGWITFGVLLVGDGMSCFKMFANRVNFKRLYHTRR
ncbi:putative transmembrane protein [Rhodanobacter sp. 115]|nr:putative transmembrane protein [Rhodanobacter sp. 115]